MSHALVLVSVAAVATMTLSAVATVASPPRGDLAILWNRTMATMLPNAGNIATWVAEAHAAAATLKADGSWPDIDYTDVSKSGGDHWQPATHMDRLVSMTGPLVACDLPTAVNPLCNSTSLANGVDAALKFWLVRNPCRCALCVASVGPCGRACARVGQWCPLGLVARRWPGRLARVVQMLSVAPRDRPMHTWCSGPFAPCVMPVHMRCCSGACDVRK
jgi:hypothetical protein